jgi:hypothetical protein
VLAADKDAYLAGLTDFREGRETRWLESFARAAARAAELATRYLMQVQEVEKSWRESIEPLGLRADSAARRLIDVLPGPTIYSQPVAVEATGHSRPVV